MKSVVEFMKEYFELRAEWSRSAEKAWDVERYGTGYRVVAEGDEEEVVVIEPVESGAQVITSSRLKNHDRRWRTRYQLAPAEESWQIARVENECSICEGTGKMNASECEVCKGTGWRPL
ncbi:MAG: hypothetical protein L0Y58_06435 [Verrucomicrobia subdivision 3 bacterium]|nr:hypothetical protein [Limisphaerales bacterium]